MAHELGKVPVHQVGKSGGATDMTNNSWETSLGKQDLANKTWKAQTPKTKTPLSRRESGVLFDHDT
jgi:hypothetical protein